jgi:hypothetical protein
MVFMIHFSDVFIYLFELERKNSFYSTPLKRNTSARFFSSRIYEIETCMIKRREKA